MKFFICTNNAHKLSELERILAELGIDAVSPKQAGINIGEIDETGTTFAQNAEIKALAGLKASEMPSVADDSGLMVDCLDGRPGIYSARYGGGGLTSPEQCELLLKEIAESGSSDRSAQFVSSICVCFPNGDKVTAEGICRGEIAYKPMGENGFGYDPIFLCGDKSFAELSAEEKDKLSHRGKALASLKTKLTEYFEKNGE